MQFIQVHVVGDEEVGKSSLIRRYTKDSFDYNHPTSDENDGYDHPNASKELVIDGHPVKLNIFETECKQNLEHRRLRSYKQADVFLICFSVTR